MIRKQKILHLKPDKYLLSGLQLCIASQIHCHGQNGSLGFFLHFFLLSPGKFFISHSVFLPFLLDMTLNKDVCAFSSLYSTKERWILCTFLYILNRPCPAHINCKTVLLQLLTTSLVCYQRQFITNLTRKATQISLCWCTTESQSKWEETNLLGFLGLAGVFFSRN